MGFIAKAMKKVTNEELKSTDGGGYRGLDAGDYVARIIDVEIRQYGPNAKNAGESYLWLQMGVVEDWDGNKVDPMQKINTGVGLFSHWPSTGKLNFTLFQFLKSLEDGWDFESDEALLEIDDEDDARETLMGETVNIRVGYRVTEPNPDYPTPNVFPEFGRFLRFDADLGPDNRLGDYETYKAKVLEEFNDGGGSTTVAPARSEARKGRGGRAKSKSKDTDTKFDL